MKKLLLLGSSLGTLDILRYAKSQGVYVIVTDYLKLEESCAKREADEYWMINTANLDELEKKCREEEITAVFCGVSDFNVEMTIKLCDRLGLPMYCNWDSWKYSVDKRSFKELCKVNSVPVAEDYFINGQFDKNDLSKIVYPVVVKPIDLSGNRGVSYCYDENQLRDAWTLARGLSKNSDIIIERMLEGEEWWAYYAMAEGEVRFLGLNAMYAKAGEPKNTYSITTSISNHVKKFLREINDGIEQVLKEVGCKEGVAWVQVMLDKDNHFYVIEMGYRLTGECLFIPYTNISGFDSIKWLVDYSLGKRNKASNLPKKRTEPYEQCACAYMLWNNTGGEVQEIRGFDKLRDLPGVSVDLLCYPGKIYDKYRTLGTILIWTRNCNEMCETLKKINERISIINSSGKEMIIKYDDYSYLAKMYQLGLEEE